METVKRKIGKPPFGNWQFFFEARQAAGLSQTELAEASGLGQTQISRFERGEMAPSIEQIQLISQPLGKPAEIMAQEAVKFFNKIIS